MREITGVSTDMARSYLTVEPSGVLVSSGQVNVRIEGWGRDGIRVRATMLEKISDDLPGALLEPIESEPEVSYDDSVAEVRNGAITVRVVLEPLHG